MLFFFIRVNGKSCPLSNLLGAFNGYLMNSASGQVCHVFLNFLGKKRLLFSGVSET